MLKEQSEDIMFMREALSMARLAASRDETPVGAVITYGGRVIAKACNAREKKKDPTAHAEITALRKAARKLGGWRLEGCTLYVTLEPCPMCAGAAINARISRIVYGARDPKAGCCGTLYDLPGDKRFNHRPEVTGCVLEEECGRILRDYFMGKREG
ncbi:MAG: tRNA adenosine(34) deaminase TadA [Bacillota bacterium]|nr:tRNA adenosine(34) deaminase TadA [Bacillota bacterium]